MHPWHIRSHPSRYEPVRRFENAQVSRPMRSDAVPRSQPDSDSQAENAGSIPVTRSTMKTPFSGSFLAASAGVSGPFLVKCGAIRAAREPRQLAGAAVA